MGRFKRASIFLLIIVVAFPVIAGQKTSHIFRQVGNGTTDSVTMDGSSETVSIYPTPGTAGFTAGTEVTLEWSPDGVTFFDAPEASLVDATAEIVGVDMRICQCEWRVLVENGADTPGITVSFSRIEK